MSRQQGPLDLSKLAGSVCVVTGAGNGGIGYGMCEVAAELGLDVAVVDLFQSVCTESAAGLQKAHPKIKTVGIQADVTKPAELAAALDQVKAAFPGKRIGAVFANAGVIFMADGVLKSKIEDWQTTFNVNVIGVVNTIKTFVPSLQESKEPSVVCTTASIGGLMRAPPNMADYCSSKHAVVALSEALSFELAATDPQIRVHICCPCIVATGLMQSSQINKKATAAGASEAKRVDLSNSMENAPFAMTPLNHGRQVWDRIAAGEFYMICDNIPPYVDHEFKLDGVGMVAARFESLNRPDFQRSIDNGGAPHNWNGAGFVSPMFAEQSRRAREARKNKSKL